MTQNTIESHSNGGMTFAGPEGVDVFRIATLGSAIGLLQQGISPTRGLTMKRALAMATEYTGKKYKRTEADKARDDLKAFGDAKARRIHTVNALEKIGGQS